MTRKSQIRKRKLLAFTDLKRGINFGSKFYNFNNYISFFDLIMDALDEIITNKKIMIVYQNDSIKKSLEESFIGIKNISNKDFTYVNKNNVFSLSAYSNQTGSLILYFKFNSWNELNLEIYNEGYEIDYKEYVDITTIFNKKFVDIFDNIVEQNYEENNTKNFNLLLKDIKSSEIKEDYFNKINLSSYLVEKKVLVTILNYKNNDIEMLNKYYDQSNIYFNFQDTKYELNEIESFKSSLKIANKKNIKTIILFDDGFKSFRVAYCLNKIWTFMDSDAQSAIILHYLVNNRGESFKNANVFLDHELSNYVEKVVKNKDIKISRVLDVFDEYPIRKGNFIYLNENYFLINNFLENNFKIIIDFLNQYEFRLYDNSLSNAYGYEEFKTLEKHMSIEDWYDFESDLVKITKLDEHKINAFKVFENNELTFYELKNKNQQIFIKYYKFDEWVYVDTSFYGEEKLLILQKLLNFQKSFEKYNDLGNKNVSEFETKRGILKLLFILIIFIALFSYTIFGIIGGETAFSSFSLFIKSYDTWQFWVLIINIFLAPVVASLPFIFVFKLFNKDTRFSTMIIATYITNFLVLVTPLNYLPFIGLFWYLSKKGIKGYVIASATFMTLLMTEGLGIIVNLSSLIYGIDQYLQVTNESIGIIIGFSLMGIIWTTSFFVLFMFILLSKKSHNFLIMFWQKLSLIFNWNNYYQNKVIGLEYNLHLTRKNVKKLVGIPKNLLFTSLLFLIWYFWWELIMYASITIVDPNVSITFAQSVGYDTILWEMNLWLPIPGKSATTELIGINLLQNVLPNWSVEQASQAIFFYRFFGWYLYGFISMFVFFGFMIKNSIKKTVI